MQERPILFSGSMVQAILAGRKTQTRRLFGPRHTRVYGGQYPQYDVRELRGRHWWVTNSDGAGFQEPALYGIPGDRLWVRETWCAVSEPTQPGGAAYLYRADDGEAERVITDARGWKPSIFMPREACRIRLEVTGVHVEPLQAITEEDARAEGWTKRSEVSDDPEVHCDAARDWFMDLWDTINGKRAPWTTNPWVWVIGFKRAEG